MVTATATRRWLYLNYGPLLFFIPSGAAMLASPIFVSAEDVVPLLVFGAGFLMFGLLQIILIRGAAHSVTVDGPDVLFSGPRRLLRVPALDIVSVRRNAMDPQAVGYVRVRTRAHGTISVAVRLHGARALEAALAAANRQLVLSPRGVWVDGGQRR